MVVNLYVIQQGVCGLYVANSTMNLGEMRRLLHTASLVSPELSAFTIVAAVRPAYWLVTAHSMGLVDLLGAVGLEAMEQCKDIEDVSRELVRREAEKACQARQTEPPKE